MPCSLCNCATQDFEVFKDREYVQCTGCKAIFLPEKYHLSPKAEKNRYILHNNDVNDPGYISFVKPVVNQVKNDFRKHAKGLDFGCGTGPVIASELEKAGFQLELNDPYFQPEKKVLKDSYDFIICCEVMEHFQDPLKEFRLLKSLLNPNGKLYCKTGLWNESINFRSWHYKDDKTHVIFYTEETLQWLQENIGFSSVSIEEELIVFNC